MQLKSLDLQEVVGNMTKMLQRLLGETITLEFQPAAENAFVLADSGMIEQVVMNLAVNARDAMTARRPAEPSASRPWTLTTLSSKPIRRRARDLLSGCGSRTPAAAWMPRP